MITIGTFSKSPDGGWRGAIRTLTLSVKALEIRPVARANDKAPGRVSALPALLIAATEGGQTFLLTLVLYIGVCQLEANLITPVVQRNVASLPVVVGIFAVVGLGILFGPLGVLFATPLALVIYTAVTMLYRHDVLGDAEASAPGQPSG